MQKVSDTFIKAWKAGKITKVYSGQDNCCRCGCRGKYYDKDSDSFSRVLSKALAEIQKCTDIDEGPGFINIPHGNDRAYTIYYE